MCYIDYRKAFDSVPHSWLVRVLKIYKINPVIIHFLQSTMRRWETVVNLKTANTNIRTGPIEINRGIFQGDSLSAIWFCLAINPLSKMLSNSRYGFDLKGSPTQAYTVSHLLYMDDLKLYAGTRNQVNQLIQIVETFTKDIKMQFGMDKCRTLTVKKGSVELQPYESTHGHNIEPMNETETYKYLGLLQSKRTEHTEIKKQLTEEFGRRIRDVLGTKLNTKHIVKAINTYVIPTLIYSFGTIKWTQTDLERLERTIRTEMTEHRMHHRNSCTERITLPTKEGGLGVADVHHLHSRQIASLREYFHGRVNDSPLHRTVCSADAEYTPLNLRSTIQLPPQSTTHLQDKLNMWKAKAIHGKHAYDLERPEVDKISSNAWLQIGNIFPETAGFLMAIQDRVIKTKNYRKFIIKDSTLQNDLCRLCHEKSETIEHVIGGCKMLAQNDYTHRHNQVAAIIHQEIAFKSGLIDRKDAYYKYNPSAVLENSDYRLYYDRTIITDHTIHNNRPDIVLYDKTHKCACVIDIAVPNAHALNITHDEKIRKYTELKTEISKLWKLKKVHLIPIVMSNTGIVPTKLHSGLKLLGLEPNLYTIMQKAIILNTCRITRKFLQE